MTEAQSKKLRVGDRVQWNGEGCTDDFGTVTETGYAAIKIQWDEAEVSIIAHADTKQVERVK